MSKQTNVLETSQFTSQIDVLLRLLDQFSLILDDESKNIKSNDTDSLILTTDNKSKLASELNVATKQLEAILSPSNVTLSNITSSDLFKLISPQHQTKIQTFISKVESCHDKNLANGMSIQILSNINQHALDLISGKPQDVKLYGSSGEKSRANTNQTTLGKA